MEIREFLSADGDSPFATWFEALDAQAAAKVTVALTRIELGNLSNVKGVGAGVQEYRIEWGPGYRLYFGRDGETLIILLCGGTKRRQDDDIAAAQARWTESDARRTRKMPLTRSFKETVKARADRDPAFRDALLTEAVDRFLAGETATGKAVLRDYINATIGFERLAAETGNSSKSLMRMLSPAGNPTADNLFAVLSTVQRASGVHLAVAAGR